MHRGADSYEYCEEKDVSKFFPGVEMPHSLLKERKSRLQAFARFISPACPAFCFGRVCCIIMHLYGNEKTGPYVNPYSLGCADKKK